MSNLIILEGCDGSGKTTLLKQLVDSTLLSGSRTTHFGNFPTANKSLPRFYLEAMLPAINGDRSVILDRCWLSEEPYGRAFRGGKLRFSDPEARMLERVALSVGAVVIHCDPGLSHCRDTFISRKGDEYLDTVDQLEQVHEWYPRRMQRSHLPVMKYDFRSHTVADVLSFIQAASYQDLMIPRIPGCGNPASDIALVGDQFGNHTNYDAHQQFPFVSFGVGCSKWLAAQLDRYSIPESDLYWVNQNQIDPALNHCAEAEVFEALKGKVVLALGDVANQTLKKFGFNPRIHHHPNYWRRFRKDSEHGPYPLLTEIDGLLSND